MKIGQWGAKERMTSGAAPDTSLPSNFIEIEIASGILARKIHGMLARYCMRHAFERGRSIIAAFSKRQHDYCGDFFNESLSLSLSLPLVDRSN